MSKEALELYNVYRVARTRRVAWWRVFKFYFDITTGPHCAYGTCRIPKCMYYRLIKRFKYEKSIIRWGI